MSDIRRVFPLLSSHTRRYILLGFLFGLIFPVGATFLQLFLSHLPFNASGIVQVQWGYPILWIVDTAPLVLGVMAGLIGRRQHALQQSNTQLQLREKELRSIQQELTELVGQRARDVQQANEQAEKRARRLEAITELSETIALIHDPEKLLPVLARSISERFGHYHTGIFLLDTRRENAVLYAANSAGGQKMLARGHHLRVGGAGIVGFVAQSGRPRLALDTEVDAVFFNNPDLPETRSEVALPLKIGSEVIGVLDVQSTQASAFDNEDVDTFSTLASQVAIVIQNARLLDQATSALEAYSRPGRRAWLEHTREGEQGYAYRPDGTLAPTDLELDEQTQFMLASGQTVVLDRASSGSRPTLAIPVRLRDQLIGVIQIQATEPNRNWSEDEVAMVQSISERAALALENARLFEDTALRAERERVISQVASRIGESNNFERILQTTIQELGRSLGTTRAFIQLQSPSSNGSNASTQDSRQA